MSSSKLSGALPAISGASLTSLPAGNLTGSLPAISGASLTSLTAANISAGSLPATVIASSIAVNGVYTNAIADGAVSDAKIASVSDTKVVTVTANKSAADNLTLGDSVIFADTSGGGFTLTLPAASASTVGKVFYIYNMDAANNVTVAPNGTDAVNGTTITTGQYHCLRVIGVTSTSWISVEMI
jgi:hypothetical protein